MHPGKMEALRPFKGAGTTHYQEAVDFSRDVTVVIGDQIATTLQKKKKGIKISNTYYNSRLSTVSTVYQQPYAKVLGKYHFTDIFGIKNKK